MLEEDHEQLHGPELGAAAGKVLAAPGSRGCGRWAAPTAPGTTALNALLTSWSAGTTMETLSQDGPGVDTKSMTDGSGLGGI